MSRFLKLYKWDSVFASFSLGGYIPAIVAPSCGNHLTAKSLPLFGTINPSHFTATTIGTVRYQFGAGPGPIQSGRFLVMLFLINSDNSIAISRLTPSTFRYG